MAPKSTNQQQSELASPSAPEAPAAPHSLAAQQGLDGPAGLQCHNAPAQESTPQGGGYHSDHGADVGSNAYQDDEDDYGVPPKKISYEQALELSKQQQGLVSVISMLQVSADVGSNAYQDDEDDYGVPPKKISYEQALELSKQQQGLVSVISMLQVIVVCMFMAGFIGYVKGHGIIKELALNNEQVEQLQARLLELSGPLVDQIVVCMFMAGFIGYVKGHGIIKELALNNEQVEQLQARLLELSGPLVDQGAIGSALWFMASSLVGGLSLLIPIAIYNVIARSADRSYGKSAGVTLYDVIRAEILKYALMIIILALAFKFTSLNALVMMATFVIVMFAQIIKSALSLGRRS